MTALPVTFSEDQASAFDSITEMLRVAGVDIEEGLLQPAREAGSGVLAITGKAGSGKTLLLAELYRALAEDGAQLLTIPAAFTVPTGRAHWHVLARARAIETGCFVAAPAQVARHEDGRETFGHSLVVDPWGHVLLDMEERCGVGFADIELAAVERARTQVPALANARPIGEVRATAQTN